MASVSFCINLQKSFLNVRKSANRLAGSFLHTSSGGLCQTAEEPHILKCPSGDVPLSKMPFGDYIWSNVEKHRNRTALVSTLFQTFIFCPKIQLNLTEENFEVYHQLLSKLGQWYYGRGHEFL